MSFFNITKAPARVSQGSNPRPRRPLLPGNRRSTTSYRNADDQRVSIDLAQLDRDLLRVLADGPKAKWALREALHVAEDVIGRQLRRLRSRGLVKLLGRSQVALQWALVDYQAPPPYVKGQTPTSPDALTVLAVKPKPDPARGSWWVGATREEFRKQIAARGGL